MIVVMVQWWRCRFGLLQVSIEDQAQGKEQEPSKDVISKVPQFEFLVVSSLEQILLQLPHTVKALQLLGIFFSS